MQPRHSTGFTLIELMVVVAIVAILAAMAAPSYRDMIDRYRLRAATDDLVSVISNARVNAVKLDTDVKVSFNLTHADGWCAGGKAAAAPRNGIAAAGVVGDCACAAANPVCSVAGESLLIPPGKHKGVGITGTSALTFDGNLGLLRPVASQTMDLSSPSGRYTARVVVRPLGQATICVPSGSPAMAGVPACGP